MNGRHDFDVYPRRARPLVPVGATAPRVRRGEMGTKMRRNPFRAVAVRLLGATAVPLAILLVGCGGQQRPPLVLAPLPTTPTTPAPRPLPAPRPVTSTTAVAKRMTTPPTVPPTTEAPTTEAPTSAAPQGGIAVRLPSPTTPTVPPTRVVRATVAPPPPTTALKLDVPANRRLPDGAFDVAVSGATAYQVVAQPAAVCAIDNGRVVPATAGACVVRATATGYATAEATIQIQRGDPVLTWRLGATTPFTFASVAMNLKSSSGGAVRATAASGACKLQDAGSISFAVGAPQLGTCTVTAVVDEGPLWNAATVTLTTTTTIAPVTVSFETPAAAVKSFSARAVLAQPDRSLDTHLAFSARSANGCTLTVSPTAPAAGSRTATINISAVVVTSRWCPFTLVPNLTDAANVVSLGVPGCRWMWIGVGQATTSAPTACPG
jgi:hypothetical protein